MLTNEFLEINVQYWYAVRLWKSFCQNVMQLQNAVLTVSIKLTICLLQRNWQ